MFGISFALTLVSASILYGFEEKVIRRKSVEEPLLSSES